jgi:putative MATE family efflux protein
MNKNHDLSSNKNILNIAYPIFLTLIAQNVINVTDTAFLGHFSEIALGASAIGGMFYVAVYIVGFGFSQGAQILIGRRNGEGNFSKIGLIFNNGLIFNLLLGIIIFIASYFSMPYMMRFLVSSDSIYQAALEYLNWRIFGFFFSFINFMFRAFYVGITKTRVLTVSAIITAGSNVFLDYAMIFGNFGFPQMGIAGAAIASVVAEIMNFIFMLCYTFFKINAKQYALFKFNRIDWKVIRQTLDLSVFMMLQVLISTSTWFLFFVFIERMGERALAVSNIGRSLYMLLMIPGIALSTTTSTLVSNMIGAGQKSKVGAFLGRMIKTTFLIALPIMLLTFAFPQLLAQIYTSDASLVADSAGVIRIVSVAIVFCAVGGITFNAVSGTGNTRTAFLFEFITMFFYVSYVYYTTNINPTTTGIVWLSEFVYWIIIGVLSFWYMRKGNWQNRKI